MDKLLAVANLTFYQAIKSRIFLNILFLGVIIAVCSFVASEFTYGRPEKVALDIGVGLLSLATKVIAVFYGVGLLQQEIENRTLYMTLSRPISRVVYFLGKFLGMFWVLLLNVFILGVFSTLLFLLMGGEYNALIFWTFFMTFLEALLLFLIVFVFSLFSSKVVSILVAISAYAYGYGAQALLSSEKIASESFLGIFLKLGQFVIPNFEKLNLKDFLLYQKDLPASFLWGAVAYAFFYCAIYLILGSFIFHRKNLD